MPKGHYDRAAARNRTPEERTEHRLAEQRAWYRKNKERTGGYSVSATRRASKSVVELVKSVSSCAECGERDPRCLDFHHLDPTTKSFSIANGVSKGLPVHLIIREINKCAVLCANCHRKETLQPPRRSSTSLDERLEHRALLHASRLE